ncbi:hypothetical protein LX97_00695 [Nonlabens dokdonensis]|uniref:Lipocalin-like domain-containing protein n=2 Tax=Nonlabens dokdonensis TaxID=328515 RepID=L7W892_NONDD|nr:hypothetical protein [Nonlabens dokdonensis]AGC76021.1 hypothetical protein DDD_0894 [Nonlabens dokdonensis DSW-6]PZX43693.1 hypothetical protein LX97_00695 [Nonlabens dokdonensis]
MKYVQIFFYFLFTVPVFGQININGTYNIIKYERSTKMIFIDGEEKSVLTSETKFEGKSNANITFFENGTVVTEGSILCSVITNDEGEIYEETEEINLDDEGSYSIEGEELIISSGELMTFKILQSSKNRFTIMYKDSTEDEYGQKETMALIEFMKD